MLNIVNNSCFFDEINNNNYNRDPNWAVHYGVDRPNSDVDANGVDQVLQSLAILAIWVRPQAERTRNYDFQRSPSLCRTITDAPRLLSGRPTVGRRTSVPPLTVVSQEVARRVIRKVRRGNDVITARRTFRGRLCFYDVTHARIFFNGARVIRVVVRRFILLGWTRAINAAVHSGEGWDCFIAPFRSRLLTSSFLPSRLLLVATVDERIAMRRARALDRTNVWLVSRWRRSGKDKSENVTCLSMPIWNRPSAGDQSFGLLCKAECNGLPCSSPWSPTHSPPSDCISSCSSCRSSSNQSLLPLSLTLFFLCRRQSYRQSYGPVDGKHKCNKLRY